MQPKRVQPRNTGSAIEDGREPLLALAGSGYPRLARPTGSQPLRVGSRLVESFSEFLASRNVMTVDASRCAGYDKMQSDSAKPVRCQRAALDNQHRLSKVQRLNQRRQQRKSRTSTLLGALLSRQHPADKLALLLGLKRAPIVLAALFSLALVLTLMVLYGLSFAAHLQAGSWQPDENRLPGSGASGQPQQVGLHRIASRQAEADAFNRALTVQTECGAYVGAPDDGAAIVFRGIRYATPPLGSRRWRRPRPIWQDSELCRANYTWPEVERVPHCAQVSPATPGQFSGSEDCLYLDIYTPKLGDQVKLLPVMFYTHGGFLAFGSSNAHDQVNWLRASPTGRLASELDVVIVAANYRLQALGFMARERLQDSQQEHDNGVANFGLWDQLGALEWVRRNIEQFAGDPRNIVLFGPDSASALPLALISARSNSQMEPRDQVFRGAWLTNPAVYYPLPVDLARLHYRRLFGAAGGCVSSAGDANQSKSDDDYKRCLSAASAEQVIRLYLGNDDAGYRLDDQNSMPIHGIFADQFVVSDGELVQEAFPFRDEKWSRRPQTNLGSAAPRQSFGAGLQLLIGSSAQAVEYWPCPRLLHQWAWPDFRRYVATSLNSFDADIYRLASQLYQLQDAYPLHNRSPSDAKLAYLSMVSDIRVTCPAQELASSLHDRGHQVHRYVIETRPSGLRLKPDHLASTKQVSDGHQLEFSHHMWDLFAFFGFQQAGSSYVASADDLQFQANLRALVRDFVHNTGKGTGPLKRTQQPPASQASTNATTSPKTLATTLQPSHLQEGAHVTLFAQDGSVQHQVTGYKVAECALWREHLGTNYAWVS